MTDTQRTSRTRYTTHRPKLRYPGDKKGMSVLMTLRVVHRPGLPDRPGCIVPRTRGREGVRYCVRTSLHMDSRFACTHKWLFWCKTSNYLVRAEYLHQRGHIQYTSRWEAVQQFLFLQALSPAHNTTDFQISCGTSDHFAAARQADKQTDTRFWVPTVPGYQPPEFRRCYGLFLLSVLYVFER